MEYRILGRTGLRVSVMGLGGGGPSRIGKNTNKSPAESMRIVRAAIDSGINIIDTAESYGTEELIGNVLREIKRDDIIISTKKSTRREMTPEDVVNSLERSLRLLSRDYIDIYNLHGVTPELYDQMVQEIVPILVKLREQGKIRFIGITEMFNRDTRHTMLQRALEDDIWDVVMVGFNLLNQSARGTVLKRAIERNIGVQIMFAVRLALSRPERLREVIAQLVESGQLSEEEIDRNDPLGFLLHEGGASSIPDAAYRFCRDEPGVHVVHSGTGNINHLRANVESFLKPPLPPRDVEKLRWIFRNVDSVTGQ